MTATHPYTIRGRWLVPGEANGSALVTTEPLSFWGGYDSQTGRIIDVSHPLCGEEATGRVLALPFSRGSSTTTAVLLESIRAGTAPAAIVVAGTDTYFALAAVVAEVMYGQGLPVLTISQTGLERIATGDWLRLTIDGTIHGQHP